MGARPFTFHRHCVPLVDSLSVMVASLLKGTDPDDTKVPVNGNNAITSQTTASWRRQRQIHNLHVYSRYHPIPYGVRGRELVRGSEPL
jgi:hypothetical protein